MMTKNPSNEREQLEMLTIDPLVPNNHLVRKLEAAIDFSFIYPLEGFVLGAIVTLENVHDSHVLQPLVERDVQKPLAVAADAAYKTPAITNFLLEN